jgi:hypothetical protein
MSSIENPALATSTAFDPAGAVEEAAAGANEATRGAFLRVAAGGAAGLAALVAASETWAASRGDVAILNYALTLEELQSAFYTETERRGAMRGAAKEAVHVIGAVERAHVVAIRQVLGSAAIKKPFFNFGATTDDQQAFLRTAVAFEDLAVAAYKGQAPLIKSRAVLAAAVSIHSVEARHAAWIRYLAGALPASAALDQPKSKAEVLAIVKATGFISATPRTAGHARPRYTG